MRYNGGDIVLVWGMNHSSFRKKEYNLTKKCHICCKLLRTVHELDTNMTYINLISDLAATSIA
jgi:hypothetical protein